MSEKEKPTSAASEVVVKIPTKTWVYLSVYMVVLIAVITLETHFLPAAWGTGGINIGPSWLLLAAIGFHNFHSSYLRNRAGS